MGGARGCGGVKMEMTVLEQQFKKKKICNSFGALCFIISRKVKMQLKPKNYSCSALEKVL